MAKNILKEAIADAKAVREVALANAKAALEEAFTPKLQSMLSAKLSEDLEEEYYEEDEQDVDETYVMEDDEELDIDELGLDMDEMESDIYEADPIPEDNLMGSDVDEEIDLEAILNELELDDEDSEETTDEDVTDIQENACKSCNETNEDFDLDLLLHEINNLVETDPPKPQTSKPPKPTTSPVKKCCDCGDKILVNQTTCPKSCPEVKCGGGKPTNEKKIKTISRQEDDPNYNAKNEIKNIIKNENLKHELNQVKKAYTQVKSELNEVNLLNSKLLYVNRIFKANNLEDSQKLRVVETLDKAESVKEAKLIYETIKDTFNVANVKKASFKRNKTKTLKEGLGMASKAAGTSTAPKKAIISESNDMVSRFQKLANIKIN